MTANIGELASSQRRSRMRKLAGEPLVQFLIVGLALFGADRMMRAPEQNSDKSRVELTESDVRKLALTWLAQGRPPPTPSQLKNLVDQKVAMEILVREAKGLGLDQDDEVIKRRLAQKMDFLFEDVAKAREPSEGELREWFARNTDRFAAPPRVDFRHLYFAADRGRSKEEVEARKVRLADEKDETVAAKIVGADQFMFQDGYTDATPDKVAKVFGPAFAKSVFELPAGSWQGPVRSGFGWHLVFIDATTPGSPPKFEDVAPQAKEAWLEEETRSLKRRAFEELKARYTVVLPPLDSPALTAPVKAAPGPR